MYRTDVPLNPVDEREYRVSNLPDNIHCLDDRWEAHRDRLMSVCIEANAAQAERWLDIESQPHVAHGLHGAMTDFLMDTTNALADAVWRMGLDPNRDHIDAVVGRQCSVIMEMLMDAVPAAEGVAS